MSFKRTVGLDWFDLLIHIGITGMLMVVVDSASHGESDGAIAAVVAMSMGLLAWRRNRALRQLGPDEAAPGEGRLQELEQRVAELELERGRLLELEERVDFAERMLTQQREREQLGRGG